MTAAETIPAAPVLPRAGLPAALRGAAPARIVTAAHHGALVPSEIRGSSAA